MDAQWSHSARWAAVVCLSSVVGSLSTLALLRAASAGFISLQASPRRDERDEEEDKQHPRCNGSAPAAAADRREAPPGATERKKEAAMGEEPSAEATVHLMPRAKRSAWAVSSASKREDPCDPRPREGYLEWDDYFMALAFLSAQRSKDPNKQVGAVIVGANKVVLGIGYNGFPRGCHDSALPWSKQPPPLPTSALPDGPTTTTTTISNGTTSNGFSSSSRNRETGSSLGGVQEDEAAQGGDAVVGTASACQSSGTALYFDDPVLETKYPYVVHAEANALLNKNAASLEGASIYVTMHPCNECAKLLIQAGIKHVIYHEGKVQDKVGGDPELTRTRAPAPSCTPSSGWAAAGNGHGACAHGHSTTQQQQQQQSRRVAPNMDACYVASKRLLALAGVSTRQHRLRRTVVICGEDGGGPGVEPAGAQAACA